MHAAYEYLRATPPFKRWKLPDADEVEFHATRHKNLGGEFSIKNGVPCIAISMQSVARTQSLMEYMAHEMVHFYLHRKGIRTDHGAPFKRCAASVCKHHGFDAAMF